MCGRLLILHWNELSFPEGITAEALLHDHEWKGRAESALSAVVKAVEARPDCRISFTKGVFHGHIADRAFMSWLEIWLGKDRVTYLKGRAIQPTAITPPLHEMDCELSCGGRVGEGITRSHVGETWGWSFGHDQLGTHTPSIQAEKVTLAEVGATNVEVPNVATPDHVMHWDQELREFGQITSNNHVIASLGRYQIIMYPNDHGYAHIHVHANDDGRVDAKYRLDVFEPLTDPKKHPDGLDTLIEQWVEPRRNALLQSWQRCQQGCYPLKL